MKTGQYYERNIRLRSVEEVTEFVSAAEKCDFTVNVRRENGSNLTANGKSLLGVLALVDRGRLDVEYNGENRQFDQVLDKFQYVSAR